MSLIYGLWIGLLCIGIIAGIYLILKDKRNAGITPKEKREFQASVFFTFVMFCMSAVTFFKIGISPVFFIAAFLMGVAMVIHSIKKRNQHNNQHQT